LWTYILLEISNASRFCHTIYENNFVDHSFKISNIRGENIPDCVLIKKNDIIWIICRGTATKNDLLTDLSWLLYGSSRIGNFSIPLGVRIRVDSIWKKLSIFLDHYDCNDASKICFTGHSLGGSIATALYFHFKHSKYNSKFQFSSVITFNSPLVLLDDSLSDKCSNDSSIASNVHNIILRWDLIPRLLGNHSLPNIPKLKVFHESNISRLIKKYRVFGNYFLLYGGRNSGAYISKIMNPSKTLAEFPPNKLAWGLSMMYDHSIKSVVDALETIH